MLLENLIRSLKKKYKKIDIKNICFDSRKIKKKDAFFSIKGKTTSGSNFIEEAISKGASVILSSNKIKNKKYKTPLIFVKDVRKSLAEAASNYYKTKPSNIIAVTGTNGKSSVADFFFQILRFNNVSVASI